MRLTSPAKERERGRSNSKTCVSTLNAVSIRRRIRVTKRRTGLGQGGRLRVSRRGEASTLVPWAARTGSAVGLVYDARGEYAQELASLQQALDLARAASFRKEEGSILNNIGVTYLAQGQYSDALSTLQEALAIRREVGNRPEEGITLTNLGRVFYGQGQYEQAVATFQQVRTIAIEVGDRVNEGAALSHLGETSQALGRSDGALAQYQQAIKVLEQVRAGAGSEQARAGFIQQYADTYHRAAILAHQAGQDQEAFLINEQGRARPFSILWRRAPCSFLTRMLSSC